MKELKKNHCWNWKVHVRVQKGTVRRDPNTKSSHKNYLQTENIHHLYVCLYLQVSMSSPSYIYAILLSGSSLLSMERTNSLMESEHSMHAVKWYKQTYYEVNPGKIDVNISSGDLRMAKWFRLYLPINSFAMLLACFKNWRLLSGSALPNADFKSKKNSLQASSSRPICSALEQPDCIEMLSCDPCNVFCAELFFTLLTIIASNSAAMTLARRIHEEGSCNAR